MSVTFASLRPNKLYMITSKWPMWTAPVGERPPELTTPVMYIKPKDAFLCIQRLSNHSVLILHKDVVGIIYYTGVGGPAAFEPLT